MKNSSMPAMPIANSEGSLIRLGFNELPAGGLTKREMMAMAAMQGQLAALCTTDAASWFTDAMHERGIDLAYQERLIAINAVNYADALLAELEKQQ